MDQLSSNIENQRQETKIETNAHAMQTALRTKLLDCGQRTVK